MDNDFYTVDTKIKTNQQKTNQQKTNQQKTNQQKSKKNIYISSYLRVNLITVFTVVSIYKGVTH